MVSFKRDRVLVVLNYIYLHATQFYSFLAFLSKVFVFRHQLYIFNII